MTELQAWLGLSTQAMSLESCFYLSACPVFKLTPTMAGFAYYGKIAATASDCSILTGINSAERAFLSH